MAHSRTRWGVDDTGQFLSRAIASGIPAGLAAGVWGALFSGLRGLPWWSALAMYTSHLGGVSPKPIVAHGLIGAVTSGLVWLVLLGMALGAVYGLLAGVATPWPFDRRRMAAVGLLLGVVVYGLAAAWRVSLLPGPFDLRLPGFADALAMGLMGAVIGACAAVPEHH